MASQRQIIANRLNSRKSSGPATEDGKLASRRNAMRHGLTAKTLLLEGETKEIFEAFWWDVHSDLVPEGGTEEEAFQRLVQIMWRLRHVPAFETAYFNWRATQRDAEQKPSNVKLAFALRDIIACDFLGKLARYETHLFRMYKEAMAEYERLQAKRPALNVVARPTAASPLGNLEHLLKGEQASSAKIVPALRSTSNVEVKP